MSGFGWASVILDKGIFLQINLMLKGMKKFLILLVVVTSLTFALPTVARPPDCKWSGYGCTVRGWLNGDGTADFMTVCDDSWGEWLGWFITWENNVPAGSC